MLSVIVVAVLALVLFGYVALPLLFPRQADPLPDLRDPVMQDLEEERDALFRAIRELEARTDLPDERRERLRARYEAKAARVLRELDERRAELGGTARAPRPPSPRRVPWAPLGLLALAVAMSATLGSYVLPRMGDGTVTAFFQEDLDAGRALRELERAAAADPSAATLLALADGYFAAERPEDGEATLRRLVEEVPSPPAEAWRRLGFLELQLRGDLAAAEPLLANALRTDPNDLDAAFALAEVRFALGRLAGAEEAWVAYLASPEGAGDPQVEERLALVREVRPLLEAVQDEPTEEELLALADAFWRFGETERAADVYFDVLTGFDPEDPVALARGGQALFLAGRPSEAALLLDRARAVGAGGDALLFLGNAYFSLERYEAAADAWEAYVADVGEEAAGRAPELIATARARAAGDLDAPVPGGPLAEPAPGSLPAPPSASAAGSATATGAERGSALYAANCATCHGAAGGGGVGPALAGNPRAADAANVEDAVRYGRGRMPGFGATLAEEEIDALVGWVVRELAGGGEPEAARP